jgi:hypothetical protein
MVQFIGGVGRETSALGYVRCDVGHRSEVISVIERLACRRPASRA